MLEAHETSGRTKENPAAQLFLAHLRSYWSKDSMSAAELTKRACTCPFGSCWYCQTNARVICAVLPCKPCIPCPPRPPWRPLAELRSLPDRAPIPFYLHSPCLFHFQAAGYAKIHMQGLWRTRKYVHPRTHSSPCTRVPTRTCLSLQTSRPALPPMPQTFYCAGLWRIHGVILNTNNTLFTVLVRAMVRGPLQASKGRLAMASASDPLIGNAPAPATRVLTRLCSKGILSLLQCLSTCCSRVCL
jgi:hypothetical protein